MTIILRACRPKILPPGNTEMTREKWIKISSPYDLVNVARRYKPDANFAATLYKKCKRHGSPISASPRRASRNPLGRHGEKGKLTSALVFMGMDERRDE